MDLQLFWISLEKFRYYREAKRTFQLRTASIKNLYNHT